MAVSPVLQHSIWRYLLRDLVGQPDLRFLAGISASRLEFALALPVAVARWVEVFRPQLKYQRSLSIVVAGVETGPDNVDDGRWYQLIPFFLGNRDLEVRVHLVGPDARAPTRLNLESPKAGESAAPWRGLYPVADSWAAAESHRMTLGEYAATADLQAVDLVLLSNPGFERYCAQWCSLTELGRVLEAGVPVGVISPASTVYEHERWLVHVHGYADTEHSDINPFSVAAGLGIPTTAIGHTLWELAPEVPSASFRPDPTQIALGGRYAEWLKRRVLEGTELSLANLGPLLTGVKEAGSFAVVPPAFVVELATGALFEMEDDRLTEVAEGVIPAALCQTYPDSPRFPFARALWAMQAADAIAAFATSTGEMPIGYVPDSPSVAAALSLAQQILDAGPALISTEAQALFAAVSVRDWPAVRSQVTANPELISATDEQGQTAFYHAMRQGAHSDAGGLLALGANANAPDREGWAVAHELAQLGDTAGIAALIGFGANLDVQNPFGWTPLMLAVVQVQSEVAILLTGAGASVDLATLAGASPANSYEKAPLSAKAKNCIAVRCLRAAA